MGTKLAKPALDAGIVTRDAEPLLAFYRGVVGMEPQEPLRIPGVGTIHKLACGRSLLRILVPETPPEPDDAASFASRAGFRYLTLEVEDVHTAVRAVRELGGRVALEPFELRPGRFVSQVADPDGSPRMRQRLCADELKKPSSQSVPQGADALFVGFRRTRLVPVCSFTV